MSQMEALATGRLEDVIESRLKAAIVQAKFSVLNGKGTSTDEEGLTKKITEEFILELVQLDEAQMTAELAKANDDQTITIEFHIPITGHDAAILKHIGHHPQRGEPTVYYNPISIDEKLVMERRLRETIPRMNRGQSEADHSPEIQLPWISFQITENDEVLGEQFANLARETLRQLKNIFQRNNAALEELNKRRLPQSIGEAIKKAKLAAQRLEEAQAELK